MRARLTKFVVSTLVATFCGCGADPNGLDVDGLGDNKEPELETIVLPLRIHLLQSQFTPDLNNTFADEDLMPHVEMLNAHYAPTGIRWEIESIVRQPVANEEEVARQLDAGETGQHTFRAMTPESGRLYPDGFDMYFIEEMTRLPGAGVSICALPAVYLARYPGRQNGTLRSLVSRGLSHELGHALGLRHVACRAENSHNMMLNARCREHSAGPRRLLFTAGQIEQMRRQARLGHAVTCFRDA